MDDPRHSLALVPYRLSHSPPPFREDCWSEEATHALIEAWGDYYLDLNRGNLRQRHWQEVADSVNAKHGNTKKTRRTDVQCKNRIDTLKKKYKIEKSRVSAKSSYASPWPFFERLDLLIGPASTKKSVATAKLIPNVRRRSGYLGLQLISPVPVAPRSASMNWLPASVDGSSFRRNFSAIAAASAAEKDEKDYDEMIHSRSSSGGMRAGRGGELENGDYNELAHAIGTLAEVYERVERSNQRQIVELEKQRMQFAKELEIQRMELLVNMQLQFERSKRQQTQPNGAADRKNDVFLLDTQQNDAV